MKNEQKPTEEQAELTRRAGLDPARVTVQRKSGDLPLPITYNGDDGPLKYWIYRRNGGLALSDERPDFRKLRRV